MNEYTMDNTAADTAAVLDYLHGRTAAPFRDSVDSDGYSTGVYFPDGGRRYYGTVWNTTAPADTGRTGYRY